MNALSIFGRAARASLAKHALRTSDGSRVLYTSAGKRPVPWVLIPGAADGFRQASRLGSFGTWWARRRWGQVLVISRRHPIPHGFTVKQHALDYAELIERLVGGPVMLECISAGGPIGLWLAATRPDLVAGLILSSTFHRAPDHTQRVFERWITLASRGRWGLLLQSIARSNLGPRSPRWRRMIIPALRFAPCPGDGLRFQALVDNLINVDCSQALAQVRCPTLVIGGEQDRLLGPHVQRELAAHLPDGRLLLDPHFGHGNPYENPRYCGQILRFADVITGHRRDAW